MKFGTKQEAIFGTKHGAYSELTATEHKDSQLTIDGEEKKILWRVIDDSTIHRGPKRDAPQKSLKTFRLHGTNRKVKLNLLYPKTAKSELRLYLNRDFKPPNGYYWFIYERSGELYIGYTSEDGWKFKQSVWGNNLPSFDEGDQAYQQSILTGGTRKKTTVRDEYSRSRRTALKALGAASYTCEFSASCRLFMSKASGKNYVEAHHFVPIMAQGDFSKSLDFSDNIVALCPFCHRAIHYADEPTAEKIVSRLIKKRSGVLKELGIDEDDLLRYYIG